jgi:hypothetical protein
MAAAVMPARSSALIGPTMTAMELLTEVPMAAVAATAGAIDRATRNTNVMCGVHKAACLNSNQG